MNCIPASRIHSRLRPEVGRIVNSLLLPCLACCVACGAPASEEQKSDDPLSYRVHYTVTPDPATGLLDVELRLRQSRALLREVTMRPNFARMSGFDGNGDVAVGKELVTWKPPSSGGSLRWRVRVEHLRSGAGYDAWLGPEWGLFRAEDIIPRARTRTRKGAVSKTRMSFELPGNWSVVTQYYGKNDRFNVKNPDRRFDQPAGWVVLGHIGVRRDTIAGVRVAVAGPTGNAVRRLEILAILNWTLPELARLLPDLPRRLTIVSAGEPMWRGGLSAPQSLFVHAERPLISENATSTLLHEVVHITLGVIAAPGYDWIVEGLAEFYSLELLARSGTISASRYQSARAQQAAWSKEATSLCAEASTGSTTAFAVTVFANLDLDLRDKTNSKSNLDDVVRELADIRGPVDLSALSDIANRLAGGAPDALHIKNLPGCHTLTPTRTTSG